MKLYPKMTLAIAIFILALPVFMVGSMLGMSLHLEWVPFVLMVTILVAFVLVRLLSDQIEVEDNRGERRAPWIEEMRKRPTDRQPPKQ